MKMRNFTSKILVLSTLVGVGLHGCADHDDLSEDTDASIGNAGSAGSHGVKPSGGRSGASGNHAGTAGRDSGIALSDAGIDASTDSGSVVIDASLDSSAPDIDSSSPVIEAGTDADSGSPVVPVVDASIDSGTSGGTLLGDPVACEPCEQRIPLDSVCHDAREQCLEATGTAAHGPKAGAPRSDLCKDLLSCFWRSGCGANGDLTSCLCGDNLDCALGEVPPIGPCKDEIFAASESEEIGDVDNRIYDTDYAVGLAYLVGTCDSALYCSFECGFCTPAAGSGPEGDDTCHPQVWDNDGGG